MMSRKALVIVGLAVVVAASTGVAFASNSDTAHVRGADADPAVSDIAYDGAYTDDHTVSDPDTSVSYDTDESVEDIHDDSKTDIEDADSEDITSDTANDDGDDANDVSFEIKRVIDTSTGEEASPRVVFGKYYHSCYLVLYSDRTLTLSLNPSADIDLTGSYTISGDTMSVDYGDDIGAEYRIIYADNGDIDYIIVNSGGYDIYFG